MKQTTTSWFLICGLLILVAALSVFLFLHPQQKKIETWQPPAVVVTQEVPLPPPKESEKLETFRHDVLGVTFSYPIEWGVPFTDPTYLTDLTRYQAQGAWGSNIHFSSEDIKNLPIIGILDDVYAGTPYPNANAEQYGSTENLKTVEANGDICSYMVAFDKGVKFYATLKEVWSECKNGVKTFITQHTQKFGRDVGTLYSYQLSSIAYKKLNNGTFQHAFIRWDTALVSQIPESKPLSREEILQKEEISLDQYKKDFAQFTSFVESFSSFIPPVKEAQLFKEIKNENPDHRTIRWYYHLLSTGKLKEALALWEKKTVSFSTFSGWYAELERVQASDIIQKVPGTYQFVVRTQEHNVPPEEYRVTMRVKKGKLQTISSEHIQEQATFGPITAFIKDRHDTNSLILKEGEKETVIDTGTIDRKEYVGTMSFVDLSFSPKGRYLIYGKHGWEWGETRIYDIQTRKFLDMGGVFTRDEKILMSCADNGLGDERMGRVYRMPEFSLIFDFMKEYPEEQHYGNFSCELNEEKGVVRYTLSGLYDEYAGKTQISNDPPEKVIEYSLETGTRKVIEEKE